MAHDAAISEQPSDSRFLGAARALETSVAIGLLLAIASLPILEILGREFLGRGVPGSSNLVQHLTLSLTFAGAALAARSGRLLTLSTQELIPQRTRRYCTLLTSAVAAAIVFCLLQASLQIAKIDRETGRTIAWGIPIWVAVAAMPLGYALIGLRLFDKAANDRAGRITAVLLSTVILLAFVFMPESLRTTMVTPSLVVLLATAALGL